MNTYNLHYDSLITHHFIKHISYLIIRKICVIYTYEVMKHDSIIFEVALGHLQLSNFITKLNT